MPSAMFSRTGRRFLVISAGVLIFLTFPRIHPLCALENVAAAHDQNIALTKDEASLSPTELLGKRVFEDATLSQPTGVSCASCHDRAKAFTGDNGSPIPGVARGSKPELLGTRNTPSLMYASFSRLFPSSIRRTKRPAKSKKFRSADNSSTGARPISCSSSKARCSIQSR